MRNRTVRVLTLLVIGFLSSLSYSEVRPLLITLDQNDDFVITGDGQQLYGIRFAGPRETFEKAIGSGARPAGNSGELTGAAPAPFQFLLSNRSDDVTLATLGSPAVVDGSFPLQFGPTSLELLEDIEVQIGLSKHPEPIDNPLDFVCMDCNFPNVELTSDGGIVVSNINEPIVLLTLISDSGVDITELPMGVSIVDASATSITLENPSGFSAESLRTMGVLPGSGLLTAMDVPMEMDPDMMDAKVNDIAGLMATEEPVFAQFTLASDISFGPFAIQSAEAVVPEPEVTPWTLLSMCLLGLLSLRKRSR